MTLYCLLVCCFASVLLCTVQGASVCSGFTNCDGCVGNAACVWCNSNDDALCTEYTSISSTATCARYKQGSCAVADPDKSTITIHQNKTMTIVAKTATGDPIKTGGDLFVVVSSDPNAMLQYAIDALASSNYDDDEWYTYSAVGEPDVVLCGDSARAWAPSDYPQDDWMTFYFDYNISAFGSIDISIFENYVPGFVTTVELNVIDSEGNELIIEVPFNDSASICPEEETMLDYQPVTSTIPKASPAPVLITGFTAYIYLEDDWPEIDAASLLGYASEYLTVVDNHDGTYSVNTKAYINNTLSVFVENKNLTSAFIIESGNNDGGGGDDAICVNATACGNCVLDSRCVWCSSNTKCEQLNTTICEHYKQSSCDVADVSTSSAVISDDKKTIIVTAKSSTGALVGGDEIKVYTMAPMFNQYATGASASDSYSSAYLPVKALGAPDDTECAYGGEKSWSSKYGAKSWIAFSFATPVFPYEFKFYSELNVPSPFYNVSMVLANSTARYVVEAKLPSVSCEYGASSLTNYTSWKLDGDYNSAKRLSTNFINISMFNPAAYNEMDAVGLVGKNFYNFNVTDFGNGTYAADVSSWPASTALFYVSINGNDLTSSPQYEELGEKGCYMATKIVTNVTSSITLKGDFVNGIYPSSSIASVDQCESVYSVPSVWYYIAGSGNVFDVSACGSAAVAQIVIYGLKPGTVPGSVESCSSSNLKCGGVSSGIVSCSCSIPIATASGTKLSFTSESDVLYYIVLQQNDDVITTNYTLTVKELPPRAPPANDMCTGATDLSFSAMTSNGIYPLREGTLVGATPDSFATCSGDDVVLGGKAVWYKVSGRNNAVIQVALCDTKIAFNSVQVYSGSCGMLCKIADVTTNPCGGYDYSYGTVIEFLSQKTETYYIIVQGKDCLEAETNFSVVARPPFSCGSSLVIFGDEVIDPIDASDYSCTWNKAPLEDYKMLLNFDPSSHLDENTLKILNSCEALYYEMTDNSQLGRTFTFMNGFELILDVDPPSQYIRVSLTLEPFTNLRIPELGEWGEMALPGTGCNAFVENRLAYLGTSNLQDVLIVTQYYIYSPGEGFLGATVKANASSAFAEKIYYKLAAGADNALPTNQYYLDPAVDYAFWIGQFFTTYNSRVYALGGMVSVQYEKGNDPDSAEFILPLVDSFYMLDPLETKTARKVSFAPGYRADGRAFSTMTVYKNSFVLFGGWTFISSSWSGYPLDLLTIINLASGLPIVSDITPATSVTPPARLYHSAVVYEDTFYVFGGISQYQYPQSQLPIIFGDLWAFDFVAKTWNLLYNYTDVRRRDSGGPGPMYLHSAAVYEASMIVFGYSETDEVYETWSFNFASTTWKRIPTSPTGNPPPNGYEGTAVMIGGNFLFSGYNSYGFLSSAPSPIFTFTIDINCNYNQNAASSACVPCANGSMTLDTFMGGVCVPCYAGSHSDHDENTCSPCPLGSFQNEQLQTTCIFCPPGFFGNVTGASSKSVCMPCPSNSFNGISGASSCNPCPATKFCPLGSSAPIDDDYSNDIFSSEQAFKDEDNDQYSAIGLEYLYLFFGFFVFWLFFVLMAFLLSRFRRSAYQQLGKGDVFNVIKYEIPGPVLRSYTVPGALVSLLAGLMIVALFVYVLITYLHYNLIMVTGIGAGFSRTDFASEYLRVDMTLTGYSGQCTTGDPSLKQCADKVYITQDGFSESAVVTCVQYDTTCEIMWLSDSSNRIRSTSVISFDVYSDYSSAYGIFWNVSANSVYDDRYSYVSGFIVPDEPDQIFRGTSDQPPSIIQLSIIPTILSMWNGEPADKHGLTVDFLARSAGQQINYTNFHTPDVNSTSTDSDDVGVSVRLELQVPQFVYTKQVMQRMTALSALSNFAALFGAILAIAKLSLLTFWTTTRVKHRIRRNSEARRSSKLERI